MTGPYVQPANDVDRQFTLLGLFNILLAHWRLVVLLPLAMMIFAVITSLQSARAYRTTSTLTTDGSTSDSRLSGIAAQFGISMAPPSGGEGVIYYEQLFESREILRELASSHFEVRSGPTAEDSLLSGTFIEITEVPGADDNERTLNALLALEGMISTSVDYESSVIAVTVTSPNPDLALRVHERLLALTDQYNMSRRRSRAKSEREFVEARLAEARTNLRAAEEQLETFLDSNRAFSSSPPLVFAQQRLQRRVDERQQLYSALAQSYEQARIDEVRNTPVLSIITKPDTVIEPVQRGTVRKGLLAFVVGLVLASVLAFANESLRRKRAAADEDYVTLVALSRSIVAGVLRVFPASVRNWLRLKLPSLYAPQSNN